ncbi:SAM-dependent methyltransferase [Streptomyces sp. NPDC004609]|uniref:SAM-dependent methyltransferase n=1 Tax=Streptomyces sp. NPDC004609 TaxID=3364704 RepID=UPI0036A85675
MDDATVDPELDLDLDLDRAHSARVYDYFLGGVTNFPADREAAAQAVMAFPSVLAAARINRRFVHRSTRRLAEQGIRQFLDIGTGIPTSPNVHEIAQSINPDSRVVYTDNDPIVLAHARALLRSHPDGATAYLHADARDPVALLRHKTLELLDFGRPVALSLNALLHFITDEQGAHAIVERLKDALPSGSALTISHATPDFDPEATARLKAAYAAAGTPGQARTKEEFARFFTGWELVEPGIVPAHLWQPDPDDNAEHTTAAEAACYAAVARKP